MATSQASRQNITLRGSTAIVAEFFGYSINSILFQRGIYPSDSFSQVSKYGLTMLVTNDKNLQTYLSNVLSQISEWLMTHALQKLVLVINSVETGEVLERWAFEIQCDRSANEKTVSDKSEKEIQNEIQAIIRQITASVTFLPMLDEPCAFDLLIYTNSDVSVPQAWFETDPRYITNAQDVRLRSFTTKIHKVDTVVSYRG